MPLTNTILNFNLSSEGVGIVNRSKIPVPTDVNVAVVLLAANANRKGAIFWNNSNGDIFIEFGAIPTKSSYAIKLNPGGYYELPFQYTGIIQGLWDTPGGDGLLIREFS